MDRDQRERSRHASGTGVRAFVGHRISRGGEKQHIIAIGKNRDTNCS